MALTLAVMDPASITGLVAAVVGLAKASGEAISTVRKQFPEERRFWEQFERQLKPDHDVDWEAIRSNCYLQPDFFGLIVGLVHGEDEARVGMEAYFRSFVEPPSGGRYDKAALIARIMRVAEDAASKAAKSDRIAGRADRRLIEGRIRAATNDVLAAISGVSGGIEQIQTDLQRLASTQAHAARGTEERLDQILSLLKLVVSTSPTAPAEDRLYRDEIEELVRRNNEELARAHEETLRRFLDERDARLSRDPTRPGEGISPEPDEAAEAREAGPTSLLPASLAEEERGDDLARLREENPQAAQQLQQILDVGGAFGVAKALRNSQLDAGPLALLVTAARLVSKEGLFAEAEQAYLRASKLDLDNKAKARQLVRAATLASIQGSEERFRRHLDSARELSPDHPALAIAEARASSNSQDMLDRVAEVEPETDADRALLHQTRAQAFLSLGDEHAARRELDFARAADADQITVREFEAVLPWFVAQRQVARGEQPDYAVLREAATRFEALAAEVGAEQRPNEAAQVAARAAEAWMLAQAPSEAERVLSEIRDAERLSTETALLLGRAALIVQRPDLVLSFVPPSETTSEARLLRAEAQALGDATDAREEGLAVLRELIDDADEDIKRQAAFALLATAATEAEVEWDERAAEILRADTPETEAGLRAERAYTLGDIRDAERLMLPYATRGQSLRRLRDYAAKLGEWEKVKHRSRELLRTGADPRDRLALADALRHLGEHDEAERECLVTARDQETPEELCEAAFEMAADIVGQHRHYQRLLELAEEWHAALPDSGNAIWNRLFALARLSRHADAYALIEAEQPEPTTVNRAVLLAEILNREAPKAEAIRRIIELSERFGRCEEPLEALVIGTALDAEQGGVQLDPDVGEQVREVFASFPDRFPDSQVIRSFPAPQTAEELEALVKQFVGDRPKLQSAADEAIKNGRAPVNVLAAVSPGGIGARWGSLPALPLGFAMDDRDAADREAASAAVGGAAIWDTSSICVVGGLGGEVEDVVRAALPGSMIVTETLEDADREAANPGGMGVAETLHDAEGRFDIREIGEQERERERNRINGMLRLARLFRVQPARGPNASENLLQEFENNEGEVEELQALLGSVLLAQRTNRPLFSDDRFIREFSRAWGVPAFGTLALVDVLAEQDLMTTDQRWDVRRRLAANNAWGVSLTGEELVEAAREADYHLSDVLFGGLQDRARWRGRPAATCEELTTFFAAVHTEASDQFGKWVRRALDAAQRAIPEMHHSWIAEVMLMMAWGLDPASRSPSDACFQALVDEVKRLPPWMTTLGYDAVLGAMNQILTYFEGRTAAERFAVFVWLFRRLRLPDQERAFEIFVRVV